MTILQDIGRFQIFFAGAGSLEKRQQQKNVSAATLFPLHLNLPNFNNHLAFYTITML